MSQEHSTALDAEIREIFAGDDGGQHPSSEVLAAYARGELTEVEAERVQEHLGPCRQCTAMVLALELPGLEAMDKGRPSDAEVAAGVEAIVDGVRPDQVEPDLSPPGRDRTFLAVAAVLAVACLGLAFFAVKLRQDVGRLEAAFKSVSVAPVPPAPFEHAAVPQTDVSIVDLYPSSVARGEAEAPHIVPLPVGTEVVVLILTPPSSLSHEIFDLRIFDAADAELWSGPVRLNQAGAFVVLLPRRLAEAGADRLVLYGIDGTTEQRLETYRVRFKL